MFEKIKDMLNRKTVKYSLIVISIIGFLVCIMLTQTQIINFIINIVETKMLHRKLESLNKWKDYLFGTGYSLTVFFVVIWFFFIKNNFYASLCFLLSAFGIYIYTYNLLTLNHDGHDLLRFPVIVLLFVIFAYTAKNRRYFEPIINRIKKIKPYLVKSKILNSSCFVFVCGALLGILFFIYIFGTTILDFTYTDWLMSGGDLSQHYLGWKLFRNSAWYFPLGLMDNIVYPFKISIIYTDSIPLFALVFKLLSPILPENFQYFGLFGIICYALQGGIGALIVRKIGGSPGQSVIGSMFFTLSTVMIWRLYFHTSLAAHFILLLCILVFLENNHNLKKQIFSWSCLLVLSVLIHLYFVPMVMIFMFFYLLRNYFLTKILRNQCVVICVTLLILFATMFCLGAFYFVKTNDNRGELGSASANLNSFFNPMGISRFIKDMPHISAFPHEGFSYLGLGIILCIIIIIGHKINYRDKAKTTVITKAGKIPYVIGVVLSFLLFSLSPTIAFNQYKLFTYPVLWPIDQLWSIFRSTGRMTWPILYIIITFCICWAVTLFSKKKAMIILCALLLIQWVDLKPWFVNKGNSFKTRVAWQTELSSSAWASLANDYKHIFFTDDHIKLYSFLDLVTNYKMTVNDAYLARKNSRMINENKQREITNLLNDEINSDTIYILNNDEEFISSLRRTGICLFNIDNVIIGINSRKAYLDNYDF